MSEQIEKLTLAQLDRFDVAIAREGDGYEYIERNYCNDGDYVDACNAIKIIEALTQRIAELEKLVRS